MSTKIAVLLTCHNRKTKTLECLQALFDSVRHVTIQLNVFLVDDGSSDGTSEAVNQSYPDVVTVMGDGSLFWNQGMIVAWKKAVEFTEFDFFLWLNDDTLMDKDALMVLLETDEVVRKKNELRLITAACRASASSDVFSYGGRTDTDKVIPNGEIQECKYVNGNLVLIPKVLFSKLGYLSSNYTHGIGDNDYGLRCLELGGKCYTTAKFIATCPPNEGIPGWCNPEVPLRKRWQLLHSPQGLNIKEYNTFRKRFWGRKWVIFAMKAYIKTIIPRMYHGISVKNKKNSINE